jgi:hypothetical protein
MAEKYIRIDPKLVAGELFHRIQKDFSRDHGAGDSQYRCSNSDSSLNRFEPNPALIRFSSLN